MQAFYAGAAYIGSILVAQALAAKMARVAGSSEREVHGEVTDSDFCPQLTYLYGRNLSPDPE
jgi:hypothetical protein